MLNGEITEEQIAKLDADDPLREYRQEFFHSDPEVCYLDGNSLGRLPLKTISATESFLRNEWGAELVDGWSHWIDEAQPAGDLLARAALGTGPGQTLVCDTTSVNLYQLCSAAIASRPNRKKVIVDSANFPTDRYIIQGLATQHKLELVTLNTDGSSGPGAVETAAEQELI
ncbi:MAG: aminotransferase, partial [Aquiluna sp.]